MLKTQFTVIKGSVLSCAIMMMIIMIKRYIKILYPYRDKDNRFHYHDNSKFLDTIVHYTEHTAVTSCVNNFGITKNQKVRIIYLSR